MAPRARVAKSKARLSAYEKLASQEYEEREDELVLQIPPGPHLGDLVVRAEGVRKGYGDNLLMEDLNFDLPRGGIVGVIGPNGAGKTTLFRMIVGQEKPDGGKLRVGETVVPAYVDQNRDALDGSKTVFEEITGGTDYLMLGKRKVASRGYVARFNFKGPDQQRKVGELSGGERNRVHLAKLLRRGGNLLLLDEPTNDLDVDTLRALEEALLNFGGCAVVISHDRWFLDRIATHILAFEGDSKTVWCEGNYQTYEAQRQAAARRRGRPAAPDPVQETASVVVGVEYGQLASAVHVGTASMPSLRRLRTCYQAEHATMMELRRGHQGLPAGPAHGAGRARREPAHRRPASSCPSWGRAAPANRR